MRNIPLAALVFSWATYSPQDSRAQTSLEDKMAALAALSEFAEQTCQAKGSRTDVELRSDLNLAAEGLVRRLIDVDVAAGGVTRWNEYSGVKQEMLEGKTLDQAGCKLEVVREMRSSLGL